MRKCRIAELKSLRTTDVHEDVDSNVDEVEVVDVDKNVNEDENVSSMKM